MKGKHLAIAFATVLAASMPWQASSALDLGTGSGTRMPPYLQCVPYARQLTGVQIYGDAHTWWKQAEGRYARGSVPKVGAVMSFRASGSSRLGHVAAVSRIIDSRTVLISHANWSPINGRRGQIERNVQAVDVSPNNDWSKVRVWYAPIKGLGGGHWPLNGFIYNEKPGKQIKPGRPAKGSSDGRKLIEPKAPAAKPTGSKLGGTKLIDVDRAGAKPGPSGKGAPLDPIGEIIAGLGK